jgi:hypothetical protein
MGWRVAVLACAGGLLLAGAGCVETHRKGGALDRAMQKDLRDRELREMVAGEEDDEEDPECPEGQEASWTCEPEPCRWVCK